jgi:hypothetical protein
MRRVDKREGDAPMIRQTKGERACRLMRPGMPLWPGL